MSELSKSNLKNGIRCLVADIIEVEPGKITDGADFVNDLGMDSMQALEIMAAIEKKFAIQIPEDYIGKISNFTNLIRVIEDCQK